MTTTTLRVAHVIVGAAAFVVGGAAIAQATTTSNTIAFEVAFAIAVALITTGAASWEAAAQ